MSTSVTKIDFSSGSGMQEKELLVYRSGLKCFGFSCFSLFQILATIFMIMISALIFGESIILQILVWSGIIWILFCTYNMLRGLYNCMILQEPVILLRSEGLEYKDSHRVKGIIAWNQIKGLEITGRGFSKSLVITVISKKEGKDEDTTTSIPIWKVKYQLPQLLSAIIDYRNEFLPKPIETEPVAVNQ